VAARIRTLEHCNLMDKTAKAVKDAGAFMVPTLVTYEMISMGKAWAFLRIT
jgi:hypothetical protein